MPIYEYRCTACGHAFELIQKMSDPPAKKCPQCGKGKIEKRVSRSAVKFEGTGWYVTDYAKKPTPLKEKSDSSPADSAGGEKKADAPTKKAADKK